MEQDQIYKFFITQQIVFVYNGTGALMLRGDDVRIQVADASQTSAIFAGGEVGIGVTPATLLDIGGMADPIVRIKSDVGGDPQLRFDGSAANRSGLIKFYDNGSNAGGFIDYHHNGDIMNFGAGSGSTVHNDYCWGSCRDRYNYPWL